MRGEVSSLAARYRLEMAATSAAAPIAVDMRDVVVVIYHFVEAGDTLWEITNKYYETPHRWIEIAEANGLKPPYTILAGQRLRLPLP